MIPLCQECATGGALATIQKRSGGYRVQIRRKGFPPESATFPIRAQAVEWARVREGEVRGARHGLLPKRTVRQALERYRDDITPKHEGARWERVRIGKFLGTPDKRYPDRRKESSVPFLDRQLTEVTSDDIGRWRDAGLKTLAPGSVRREYGLLRSVFAMCEGEWGWLHVSPFKRAEAPQDGKARKRRVSDAEADAIAAQLGYRRGTRPESSSEFTAVAFLLALETMMRQGEILTLTADQVFKNHIHLEKTKNGDERDVPLTDAAIALVKLLPKEGALFPITSQVCDTLFRRAREKAEISGLHFHDSRREATTRLAKRLDPLELAKAGGWRDVNMLLRVYYAQSVEETAAKLRTGLRPSGDV